MTPSFAANHARPSITRGDVRAWLETAARPPTRAGPPTCLPPLADSRPPPGWLAACAFRAPFPVFADWRVETTGCFFFLFLLPGTRYASSNARLTAYMSMPNRPSPNSETANGGKKMPPAW